jgi:hypothetical protein
MRDKFHSCSGKISNLEMGLILFIAAMLLFLGYRGIQWMAAKMAHGNDSLLVNTAESEARINSNNGMTCVVQNCPSKSGGVCPHLVGNDGTTVGYLDNTTKYIIGEKPYGYNEGTEMDIDGVQYFGEKNTMVIRVSAKDGVITASWVPGRSNE